MSNKESRKYDISIGLPQTFGKVILIDCMDTILYRDITLDYLLALWAKQMGRVFKIFPKFLLYYRREVVKGKMHNTVPIEVIYGDIYEHCCYFGLIKSCSKDEFISTAHSIELNIELHHQHPITDTIDYLKKAKEKGEIIYCVSDFRLSSTDLKQFFSHLGIENLFDEVYSSCDVGKTKKTGLLYPHVLEVTNKEPLDCIMIGDNKNSDCINANKNSIKSYWIQKSKMSKIYAITSRLKTVFINLK